MVPVSIFFKKVGKSTKELTEEKNHIDLVCLFIFLFSDCIVNFCFLELSTSKLYIE